LTFIPAIELEMDNTCKTLTVSYGAFSCTLEKLSDPVAALKLITDNFRDLVASDQYLRSEPRTPNDQELANTVKRDTANSDDAVALHPGSETTSVKLQAILATAGTTSPQIKETEFTEDLHEPDAPNVASNLIVDETSRKYETISGDDQSDEATESLATLDGVEEFYGIKASVQNKLSDDDEADLMQKLVGIKRHYEIKPTPQKRRCALPETDSTTISRILNQTDKLLREPSGRQRRSAMAEMKAAVAVIEALGCVDLNGECQAHFTASRQEPLKLVASQRVY
jgi:hypothetical protein